jgi:2-haloalkanoic acid dehalogenase type II
MQMSNDRIKAIIFDAFGTLFDTKDASVRATGEILEKNRSSLNPEAIYREWKAYHEHHIASLTEFVKEEDIYLMDLQRIYQDHGIHGNAEEDVKIMLSTFSNRQSFPEASKTIDRLRERYRVYIGSNSDSQPLKSAIELNKIVVDGYFSSESLQVYKPQREFFLRILQAIGMEAYEALYVGDSQIDDLLGASKVKIGTFWINRRNERLAESIPQPLHEVKSLDEILSIL